MKIENKKVDIFLSGGGVDEGPKCFQDRIKKWYFTAKCLNTYVANCSSKDLAKEIKIFISKIGLVISELP